MSLLLADGYFYSKVRDEPKRAQIASDKGSVVTNTADATLKILAQLRGLGVTSEHQLKLEYFYYSRSATNSGSQVDVL